MVLVRCGRRCGSVDGCVGREHCSDRSPAGYSNRETNQGGNSARGSTEETVARSSGGANAGPYGSADYKAHYRVPHALGR